MPRYLRVLVAAAAVIIIAGGGFMAIVLASSATPDWLRFWEDDTYEYHGGFYEPPREAHELINAVDQNGDDFTLRQFEGKTVFIYFGYTNCPDFCPATLAEWREVKAALGEDAEDVEFVMITVDPERDTPERMKEYLGFWDPEFWGVTMSPEDTKQVALDWGVQYSQRDAGSQSGYLVDHDVYSLVIGPGGDIQLTYPLNFNPDNIAEDIRHLQDAD